MKFDDIKGGLEKLMEEYAAKPKRLNGRRRLAAAKEFKRKVVELIDTAREKRHEENADKPQGVARENP